MGYADADVDCSHCNGDHGREQPGRGPEQHGMVLSGRDEEVVFIGWSARCRGGEVSGACGSCGDDHWHAGGVLLVCEEVDLFFSPQVDSLIDDGGDVGNGVLHILNGNEGLGAAACVYTRHGVLEMPDWDMYIRPSLYEGRDDEIFIAKAF